MLKHLLLACGASFVLSAGAEPAAGLTEGAENWRVSGFGPLGLSYHGEDNFRFRRSIERPVGARNGTLDYVF